MTRGKASRPNWSDLEVLAALFEGGTLLGAGERLGVDSSTVSRRVRALERALGARLVENVSGRLQFTVAGQAVVDSAVRMKQELLDLSVSIATEETEIKGTLTVGTLDLFVRLHADVLARFSAAHPKLVVEYALGAEMVSVAGRDADVVIRWTREPPETLVGRRLFAVKIAAYCHESIADSSTLASIPWIGRGRVRAARPLNSLATRLGVEQRVYADSESAMLDLMLGGAGIGLLPLRYARRFAQLRMVDGPFDELETDVWILTHRDLVRTPRVAAFLEHMAATPWE